MYKYTNLPGLRSLRNDSYRIWAAGSLVSNIGTWMQRIAQDWVVLTQVTDHNVTAVGIVTALQFAPQILLLPWSGYAADHLDRRKLLLALQAAMGFLALGLGLLTLLGAVTLWEVYVFAFLLGCATALDAPTRHTFISELVPAADLSNAVALNSASFNAAQMVGPALAGLLMARVAPGWVFLINAASFGAVLLSLLTLRPDPLQREAQVPGARGSLADGFRYVAHRAELRVLFLMALITGALGIHFAICISAMALKVFHQGAGQFGLATSVMAVGSILGALAAGLQSNARMGSLVTSSALLGVGVRDRGGDAHLRALQRDADSHRRGRTELQQCLHRDRPALHPACDARAGDCTAARGRVGWSCPGRAFRGLGRGASGCAMGTCIGRRLRAGIHPPGGLRQRADTPWRAQGALVASSMRIQRMTPDDTTSARALFALMADVFAEPHRPPSDLYLGTLLQRADFWALAAFEGSEIVGGLTAHTLPMTSSETSEIFIYDIAVREDRRRRGVGRALVSALLEAASRTGVQVVFVPADNEDSEALDFYRALGATASHVTLFSFSGQSSPSIARVTD